MQIDPTTRHGFRNRLLPLLVFIHLLLSVPLAAFGAEGDVSPGRTPLPDGGGASQNGDLNADGVVNVLDALEIFRWQLEGGPEPAPINCDAQHLVNGDINGNGVVDMIDAVDLLRALLDGDGVIVPACEDARTADEIADEDQLDLDPRLVASRGHDMGSTTGTTDRVANKDELQESSDIVLGPVDAPIFKLIRPTPVYKVRLHVIRTADNDGSRAATLNPASFQNLVQQVNNIYWTAGVEFEFDPTTDFEHIDSTMLNHKYTVVDDLSQYTDPNVAPPETATNSTWNTAFRRAMADLHRGKIVLFFSWGSKLVFDEGLGHWVYSHATGGSSSGAGRWVNMPRNTGDRAFVAHELGHYLKVPHPFRKTPTLAEVQERIRKHVDDDGYPKNEGLNSLDGDRAYVLDTPADPSTVFWRDVVNGGTGDACGPVGSYQFPVNFADSTEWYTLAPDRNNVMSYFKSCYVLGPRRFSSQQVERIRDGLENLNRHDLVSLRAGNVPWELERKGDVWAESVDTTDVVRVGLNRLVTTSIRNDALQLIVWDVDPDNGTFTRRGDVLLPGYDQVKSTLR